MLLEKMSSFFWMSLKKSVTPWTQFLDQGVFANPKYFLEFLYVRESKVYAAAFKVSWMSFAV